jgi:flagellar hook-basal body complex protein FliE
MAIDNINQLGPIQPGEGLDKIAKVGKQPTTGGASFEQTLKSFMTDVNDMQNKASQSIDKLAAGEITDVHQVMTSVEEANTAFNMMMEIRNKVMDAYQEIMRMRL